MNRNLKFANLANNLSSRRTNLTSRDKLNRQNEGRMRVNLLVSIPQFEHQKDLLFKNTYPIHIARVFRIKWYLSPSIYVSFDVWIARSAETRKIDEFFPFFFPPLFNHRWTIRARDVSITNTVVSLKKNKRARSPFFSVLVLFRKYFFRVSGPGRQRTGRGSEFFHSPNVPRSARSSTMSHESLLDKSYSSGSVVSFITNLK